MRKLLIAAIALLAVPAHAGFNGSGQYVLPYNWENDAANGLAIRADRMDGQDADIAAALSNTITRDGQGVPTAAINWGGQNLSNVNVLSAASLALSGPLSAGSLVSPGGATGGYGGRTVIGWAGSGPITGEVAGTWVIDSDNTNRLRFYSHNLDNSISTIMTAVPTTGVATFGQRPLFGSATPWDSGNLNPAIYAPISGTIFTGDIGRDGAFLLTFNSTNPEVLTSSTGSGLIFNRTLKKWYFQVDGVNVASIDASGNLKVAGNITANTTP
ncbi:MAG: hypothetical protein JOY99_11045 [Sphingomonadaceae bacterium]|nr:hypothetical protein [Sphingomonadaceae bacterium]